ncbi:MAG: MarR family transcriptional regulator, partial [Pseudomonadota bacterium]
SRPIVSNATRRLVDQGLLTPVTTSGDARARPLTLTADGHNRLAALLPGYFNLIRDRMAQGAP